MVVVTDTVTVHPSLNRKDLKNRKILKNCQNMNLDKRAISFRNGILFQASKSLTNSNSETEDIFLIFKFKCN